MSERRRLVVALIVLAGGGVGAPFVSLPCARFGWQLYAQVYEADLEIHKISDAGEALQLGDQLTYTITVINNGPAGATGVAVNDALPSEVDYVGDSCGGAYSAGTHTWAWAVGGVAASASTSCDMSVEVVTGEAVSFENGAVVSGSEPDPTPGNNSSSVTDTARASPIPLLSRWGLGALVVAMALLAIIILGRRAPSG